MRSRSTLATITLVTGTLVIGTLGIGILAACGSSSNGTGSSVIASNSTTVTTLPGSTELPTSDDVPTDLAGVSWMLDGHITVAGLQLYPAGTGAGVTFNDDATLDVDTGCNTGTAPVTFEGEYTVLIGPLTMTEMACTDADNTTIEQGLLFVLAEPLTWSVHDGVMTLIPQTISDTGLHFVPA